MTTAQTVSDPILRMPGVKAATGLSRATIYRLIKSEDFPKPKKLSSQAVGWPTSVINSWLSDRPTGAPT